MKRIQLTLKALSLALIIFSIPSSSFAQTEGNKPEAALSMEEMPVFPGGEAAMLKFVSDNTEYPKYERKKKIQGVVYVQFTIEKDGSVSNIKTTKTVEGEKNLSKEAERVIGLLPNFKPAMHNGEPVRLNMTLPVRFKLKEGKK